MACFVTVPDLDLLAHAPKAGWIENSVGVSCSGRCSARGSPQV